MNRCELSDLPVDQCACRIHKPDEPTSYGDIEVRFPARFDSTLACGHKAQEGDEIARTTDAEYICGRCAA